MTEKKINVKKPSKNNKLHYLMIINILQFGLIIYLWSEVKAISHGYADEDHSHDFGLNTYAKESHSHSYADSYHSHSYYADEDHSHDADDITYNSFGYGGYGTVKKAIKDKADENHTHSSYEIPSHTHQSFEVYGVAKSYHMH